MLDETVKLKKGGTINVVQPLSNILNLSSTIVLTENEKTLLERGLSFIPTPLMDDRQTLKKDLYNYHRKLKLLEHFNFEINYEKQPFTYPSTWEPEKGGISSPIQRLIKIDQRNLKSIRFQKESESNLTLGEQQALKELKTNTDIVIKPADKGSKVVIMDKFQYLTEAYKQLNNRKHYLPLKESIQLETQRMIRDIVQNLYEKKKITAKQKHYLFGEDPPRPRKFYLLPKIHKDPKTWTVPYQIPTGRPIISDCGSESYRIAEFIDYFLNPLSQTHNSYIKDTYAFVSKLKQITIPLHAMLFTIDIDALYTNIQTDLGLKAVRDIFGRFPDPVRPDKELLELLEISLNRNDFEFNQNYFLQVHGTAMGKKFAPAYANIYMADWERTVFQKCTKVPSLYLRFLDDIFGIWPHSKEDFDEFIAILNNHHSSISVKYNLQSEKIEFLDTEVYIQGEGKGEGKLGTRVFFKPTDTHSLLHKTSFHPKHTFGGIVKSQLIRYHKICTKIDDVESATRILFKALRKRGYSRTFLRNINKEVKELYCDGVVPNKKGKEKEKEKKQNLVPFISTYSSTSWILNSKIKKNFKRCQDRIESLTQFKTIAAFRKNQNLKDILVHASLTNGIKKDKYSQHFKRVHFLENRYTHQGLPVGQTLGQNAQNVIYCIQCQTCGKLYIGQTKNTLLQRLKQHLYAINKTSKDTYLYQHFRLHGSEQLIIMGLESGSWWTDRQRLRRETFWVQTLKTYFPNGLNQM